jgi:acyl-CoA synthetase (AMP-forming)/AMP-acid ligase II
LAYYLKKIKVKRVGLLCPNTPAFLESVFGIGAAGAVNVGESIRQIPLRRMLRPDTRLRIGMGIDLK